MSTLVDYPDPHARHAYDGTLWGYCRVCGLPKRNWRHTSDPEPLVPGRRRQL